MAVDVALNGRVDEHLLDEIVEAGMRLAILLLGVAPLGLTGERTGNDGLLSAEPRPRGGFRRLVGRFRHGPILSHQDLRKAGFSPIIVDV